MSGPAVLIAGAGNTDGELARSSQPAAAPGDEGGPDAGSGQSSGTDGGAGVGGRGSSGGGGGGPGQGDEAGGGGGGVQGAPPPHSGALRILAAGCNAFGVCGVLQQTECGRQPDVLTPVTASGLQPPQGAGIAKVCLGNLSVVVLTAQGDVMHAGCNDCGQRGTGQRDDDPHHRLCMINLGGPAADTACGEAHVAVALCSGAAATWGNATDGAIGRHGDQTVPGDVEGVSEVERVYAGGLCTFFFARGGEVAACGSNHRGQLALGHTRPVSVPQRVTALCGRRIRQLQVGGESSIMLDADGSVRVWGYGLWGPDAGYDWGEEVLADGSAVWSAERGCVPIRLDIGPARCVAAAGGYHCAVVLEDGLLLVWGLDSAVRAEQPSPVQLPGDQPATAVTLCRGILWARSAKGEWAVCGVDIMGLNGSEERLLPFSEVGLSPHCMPLSYRCPVGHGHVLFLEGRGAEGIWHKYVGMTATGVLRAGGVELQESDYQRPLADVGVSAEGVVELLRLPHLPPAAGRAGAAGAFTLYVNAPGLGKIDHVCLELHPDATVLDLAAAAVERLGL